MRSITWGRLLILLFIVLVLWWWTDPVGFYQNPVLTWFKGLSVPLPERLR